MMISERQRIRLERILTRVRGQSRPERHTDRVVAPARVRDALRTVWSEHDHPSYDQIICSPPAKLFAATAKVIGERPRVIDRVLRGESLPRRTVERVQRALEAAGALRGHSR